MAIDSRNGQTVCSTNTTADKNVFPAIVANSLEDCDAYSIHDTVQISPDTTISLRFFRTLSEIPVFQDGVPSICDGGFSLLDRCNLSLRSCPNNSEGTGDNGGNPPPQVTEDYGGARPRSNVFLNFGSSGGGRGGHGDGDDEEDKNRPSNYSKKRLNCDHKSERTKESKPKRDGLGRVHHRGRGMDTDSKLGHGHKPPTGTDEIDAGMVEQGTLLGQLWTTHRYKEDCVIYSTQHGAVVAFVQRLYSLWSRGLSLNPDISEGVIFDPNLVIGDSGQYLYGEHFQHYAELGRGDFGITRACQDSVTGAKMASKEIPRERFLPFEVLQLSKLRSPFIAQFLGATAEGNSLFLHMELVDNAYQLEYIASDVPFLLTGQDLVVKILLQLLGALDCLSRCGIIHRDLTCRNVLLTSAERVKVIDFNLAVPSPYEQNTMPVGDIRYLAPEVLDGVKHLTCAIDMWSVGIIIISLLRGLPQFDNCEKMAITGFHPLNCCHLDHVHPQLLDILQQVLRPDWRERPPAAELVKHIVFQVALHEELEQSPARPDDGQDSPDWSFLYDESSDSQDVSDEDTARPLVGIENLSEVATGGGHMSLVPVSELSAHQLKAHQDQPRSLPVVGASAVDQNSSGGYLQESRQPQGARRKVRKARSSKVQIAASFIEETPENRNEHHPSGKRGKDNSLGPRDDALQDHERPITQQSTPQLLRGAEVATTNRTHRRNQRGRENLDSLAEVVRGVEVIELTKSREWKGMKIEQEDSRMHGHQSRSRRNYEVLSQRGDQVPSQAITSTDFQTDLCDGPYGYPENWLYAAESQKSAEEPQREQSGGSRHSPLVSNGGSSARGTSLDEVSLEKEILMGQLSLDNPDLHDEILQLSNTSME